MTGLFSNIRKLQDEKALTFLYRAPRIEMKPLNIGVIAQNYQANFGIDGDKALNMAKQRRGIRSRSRCSDTSPGSTRANDETLADFKQYLDDCAYEKIWSEFSDTDRRVAAAIARTEGGKIADVRKALSMDTNQFNPYRDRLIKRGAVNGGVRGHVSFTLPLFERYVIEHT